jgi:diguanylate cyclase (GGDEF)-like protein/PAS domain S-box-containing protein
MPDHTAPVTPDKRGRIRLTVTAIIWAGFCLATLAGVTVFSLWLHNAFRADELLKLEEKTRNIIADTHTLTSQMKDAENGARGYIITGVVHQLETYQVAVLGMSEVIERQRSALPTGSLQRNRFERVGDLANQHMALLKEAIDLRHQKDFGAAQRFLLDNLSEAPMQQLQALTGELLAEQNELLEQGQVEAANLRQQTTYYVVFGDGIAFLVLFLATLGTVRRIRRPLENLIEGVSHFGHGNLSHRIPVLRNDEFGQVAQHVNAMANELACADAERRKAENFNLSRSSVLELMAAGAALPEVLNAVVRGVEQNNPEMMCSILLLDDESKRLYTGAAPCLPDFFSTAVNGMEIGMGIGSCGTAAFSGERVIVEDIQNHPYWARARKLAGKAGLAACWSEPIRSAQGKILGTFAIYHADVHKPDPAHIHLIEQTAHLASIAIEKSYADQALAASEARWRFALEGAGDGVWELKYTTDSFFASPQLMKILGIVVPAHDDALLPMRWAERVHPDYRKQAKEALQKVVENRTDHYRFEQWVRCEDGSYKWLLIRGMVVSRSNDGVLERMIGTATDISEQKQVELKLQLAASVFSHAREGIFITDGNGTILNVNYTFTALTGYTREEAIGQNSRILRSDRHPPEFHAALWKSLLENDHWSGEIWNQRKNGEDHAVMITISAVRDGATRASNYVALFTDITAIKDHQRQLEHLAHYDALTGLPNRVLLTDRLRQAMAISQRRKNLLAVAYLDLDGFKAVNDNHGHEIGDELLIAISKRMKHALRDGDTLARIGGDEFVAVLVDLDESSAYEPVLARLLIAAADPVPVRNLTLRISTSIGVTLSPQDSGDVDQLMRHADQAMYIAKQNGKNRFHLFDIHRDAAVKTQRESLEHIHRAIRQHEFVLHYQPKVNLRTGSVIGVEALIRWQHPEQGLLAPGKFLPVIEDHPISIDLGEWVISTALAQISTWHAAGLDLPVSVNIGARQLQEQNFVSRLLALLAEHPDVPPRHLELEILETSGLEDIGRVAEVMHVCHGHHIGFALDDFGTGYSSLTYLRRLPAYLLKIDQSFVLNMLDMPEDMAIVKGVIGLAAAFRRQVIAEGVETEAHGKALLDLGCELAQGYGIARPMPAEKIPEWVAHWKPDADWLGH